MAHIRIEASLEGNGNGIHMESALTTAKHLSQFQKEKFSYLFDTFFDIRKNGLLEHNDIDQFAENLRQFSGWSKDSPNYSEMLDILSTFYECICDQLKLEFLAEEGSAEDAMMPWEAAFKKYTTYGMKSMNLQQWLNMWGRLCYGSAGISDFPIWVQLLPDMFFRVIDRDQDGLLAFEEVKYFYKELIGIKDPAKLDKVSTEGYRAMTANGDYKLIKENYNFCFANFLLGKGIYGPGKYVFGAFDNREIDEQFPVQYNEEE